MSKICWVFCCSRQQQYICCLNFYTATPTSPSKKSGGWPTTVYCEHCFLLSTFLFHLITFLFFILLSLILSQCLSNSLSWVERWHHTALQRAVKLVIQSLLILNVFAHLYCTKFCTGMGSQQYTCQLCRLYRWFKIFGRPGKIESTLYI